MYPCTAQWHRMCSFVNCTNWLCKRCGFWVFFAFNFFLAFTSLSIFADLCLPFWECIFTTACWVYCNPDFTENYTLNIFNQHNFLCYSKPFLGRSAFRPIYMITNNLHVPKVRNATWCADPGTSHYNNVLAFVSLDQIHNILQWIHSSGTKAPHMARLRFPGRCAFGSWWWVRIGSYWKLPKWRN